MSGKRWTLLLPWLALAACNSSPPRSAPPPVAPAPVAPAPASPPDAEPVMPAPPIGPRPAPLPIPSVPGMDRSSVRFAPPSVSGLLSPEAIRRRLIASEPRMRACHARGFAENPEAAGRVVVEFIISADGRVSSARVRDANVTARGVADCVVEVVRGLQFARPEGGTAARVFEQIQLDRVGAS